MSLEFIFYNNLIWQFSISTYIIQNKKKRKMKSLKNYSQLSTQRLENIKTIKSVVRINENKLNSTIQIYKWRSSTQFPIPKLVSWKINTPKLNRASSQQNVQIQVEYFQISDRLSDYQNVPLFKLLYLFKQALIGFERLCNQYCYFHITDRNIMIDADRKCKVWLTDKIQSNFIKKVQLDQNGFVAKLINIFYKHCLKSKQSIQFFEIVKTKTTFSMVLKYIQLFTKSNKIIIPSNFIQIKNPVFNKYNSGKYYQQSTLTGLHQIEKQPIVNNVRQSVQQCQNRQSRESLEIKMKSSSDTAETQALNKKNWELSNKSSIEQEGFKIKKNKQLQVQKKISESLKHLEKQRKVDNQVWKSQYDKIKPTINSIKRNTIRGNSIKENTIRENKINGNTIRRISNVQKISPQFKRQLQNFQLESIQSTLQTPKQQTQNDFQSINELTKSITFQQDEEINSLQISQHDSQEQIMNLKRQQKLQLNNWNLTNFEGLLQNCRVMGSSFLQKSNTPRKKQIKFDYLDKYRNSLFQSRTLQQQKNFN